MKKIYLFVLFALSQMSFSQVSNLFDYHLDWATYYGGYETSAVSCATDTLGNVYLGSNVFSNDPSYSNTFVTPNTHQTTYDVPFSVNFPVALTMITKFNANGERLWSTFYGGTGAELTRLVTDKFGNIIITGIANSAVGIATPNSFQTQQIATVLPNGSLIYESGFIAKFNTDGELLWGTYFPTYSQGLCTDSQANIYIIGTTRNTTNISTSNTFQPNFIDIPSTPTDPNPSPNGYLTKFDTNGNRVWGTYYGNSYPNAVAVDDSDNVYLAGVSNSTDSILENFYATPNCYLATQADSFLVKFNSLGQRVWGTFYDGGKIQDLQINRKDIYIAGLVNSNNTNVATPGAYQNFYGGGDSDSFLGKFNDAGFRVWSTYYGGSNDDNNEVFLQTYNAKTISFKGTDVYFQNTTNSSSNIASAGSFQENLSGVADAYIVKFNQFGDWYWATYFGGENFDGGSEIITDGNDKFYICGTTSSFTGISTSGCQQPNKDFAGVFNASNTYLSKFELNNLQNPAFNKNEIILFPNPNNGQFVIKGYTNEANLKIFIYDISGRLISQKKIFTEGNQLNQEFDFKELLSNGIYFVKLFSQKNLIKTFKIIIK